MTREKIKKLLPIIQAWVDGKTIQVWTNDIWVDEEYPCFFEELSQFRIKPESKYRPFKTQKECWEEMHNHPNFGFIREKSTKVIYSIAMIDNFYLSTQDKSEHLCDTMDVYEFMDGEPFGIKEE